MLRRRMATLALPLMRSFSIKPVINVKSSKIHETIIVQNCGGKILRWIGPVSRFQMFCSILLSGSLVYQSDASALMMEVLATSGAICSASATVYFGAKRMCDKVVTDIMSCRKVGDPNEFVRVLVMGIGSTEVLEANPKDVKLLGYDGQDVYTFLVGGRQLQLDASTGEYVNRKALDMLMQDVRFDHGGERGAGNVDPSLSLQMVTVGHEDSAAAHPTAAKFHDQQKCDTIAHRDEASSK